MDDPLVMFVGLGGRRAGLWAPPSAPPRACGGHALCSQPPPLPWSGLSTVGAPPLGTLLCRRTQSDACSPGCAAQHGASVWLGQLPPN